MLFSIQQCTQLNCHSTLNRHSLYALWSVRISFQDQFWFSFSPEDLPEIDIRNKVYTCCNKHSYSTKGMCLLFLLHNVSNKTRINKKNVYRLKKSYQSKRFVIAAASLGCFEMILKMSVISSVQVGIINETKVVMFKTINRFSFYSTNLLLFSEHSSKVNLIKIFRTVSCVHL